MITDLEAFRTNKEGNFLNADYYSKVKTLLDIIIELGKPAEQTEFVNDIRATAEHLKTRINEEMYKSLPAKVRNKI